VRRALKPFLREEIEKEVINVLEEVENGN